MTNPASPVSDRELQVLALIAEGKTSKAVARDLGLKLVTVNDHLKSVYVKLDVHTRTAAVVKAMRAGMLR